MLINQGVIGIKYWTGIDADADVMRKKLEEIFIPRRSRRAGDSRDSPPRHPIWIVSLDLGEELLGVPQQHAELFPLFNRLPGEEP
jgi:hypothetical protein